jgi:hypothetical protein
MIDNNFVKQIVPINNQTLRSLAEDVCLHNDS